MLRILRYLKRYKLLVFFGVLFLFLQAMSELFLPLVMADIVNIGMIGGDISYIFKTGIVMLLATLFNSVCAVFGSLIAARISSGVARDLRGDIFRRTENYSLDEFDLFGTASLITRTTNDVTQIQSIFAMGFRFILYSPIIMIGGFFMAFSKNGGLTLILVVAVFLLMTTMFLIARVAVPYFSVVQKKIDALNLIIRENLMGIRVIRAFNKMETERKNFHKASKDLTNISIKVNRTMAIMHPSLMFLTNVTLLAIIWFSGQKIAHGDMLIGDMMAFIQYTMQIMFSVVMVAVMFVMIPRAQVSAVRVLEVLDYDTKTLEPEKSVAKKVDKAALNEPFVMFKNVSFSYEDAEEPVLKNISFTCKKGQTTAIIGGTGAGKTTIVNLLPRFYDATSGEIFVNGENVKNYRFDDLRGKIGLVPQVAILFSGTISENIRFGKENSTDKEIFEAAKTSQALEFIELLENKFDHVISQGGKNVSGGQRQRLTIARAIVREPEIYVFDDSFSALDLKTDMLLRQSLKEKTQNSAVIIVAQRVSTVSHADQILVLDDGEIVGRGTHSELLETCEIYKEIVASQMSQNEDGGAL